MIKRQHTGHRCGESCHKAKLTLAQVKAIREKHEQGMGYRRLGRLYGRGDSTIRDIVTYRTWWHV